MLYLQQIYPLYNIFLGIFHEFHQNIFESLVRFFIQAIVPDEPQVCCHRWMGQLRDVPSVDGNARFDKAQAATTPDLREPQLWRRRGIIDQHEVPVAVGG